MMWTLLRPRRVAALSFAFVVALTMVVGTGSAADAAWTKNCATVNAKYPDGVGKKNAADQTAGVPVTTFKRSNRLFRKVKMLDADRDKIACERHSGGTTCVPSASADVVQARATILQQTNSYRASIGRAPVAAMGALDTVAQCWTQYMAGAGTLVHNANFASQYPPGWLGGAENIASGQTPATVVQAWIGSPVHQANLAGDFNYIGIGYAVAGSGQQYFTQNFAKY